MMQNDPCDFSPTLLLCQIEAALTRNAHSLKSIIWNLSERYEGPDGPSLVKIEGHKANVTPKELSILFDIIVALERSHKDRSASSTTSDDQCKGN